MRALTCTLLLGALPALAVEGAASAELTVGRQVALSATFELSPLPDRLWLVLGYGLLRSPDVAATETTPKIVTAPSHLVSGGLDFAALRQLTFSLLAQGSPKASETVPLTTLGNLSLTTTRQSAGGTGLVIVDSAGDSAFELSVDAGAGFTWNQLTRTFAAGPITRIKSEPLFVTRPQLGVTALLGDTTTAGVRAGYTFYSADPLRVGRLSAQDLDELEGAAAAAAQRLSGDVELSQAALRTVLSRLAAFDAVSGYPSGPVRFDLKLSVGHDFGKRFTGQVSWTYLRYVPGQGFGNVLALKATFKFNRAWRAWVIGAAQLDEPLDFPRTRTDTDPKASVSGHLSAGAEFSF